MRTRSPRGWRPRIAGRFPLGWPAWLASVATFALPAFAPGLAAADVFQLASGGRLVGELLNADEIPRETYDVKTPAGVVVSLDRRAVAKHEKQRPVLEEYAEIKPSFPDTLDGQRALAEWCRERHLNTQRDEALQRVIEFDPNDVPARRVLGHVKKDGVWISPDQAMVERGYILFRGRWRTPQEIQAVETAINRQKAEDAWTLKLERMRTEAMTLSPPQALLLFRGIRDPLALKPLVARLHAEGNRNMRTLYVQSINSIGGPSRIDLLGAISLCDRDEDVRVAALDCLRNARRPDVAAIYMSALRHPNPTIVNRAANALGILEAESAIPSLIDALVTLRNVRVSVGYWEFWDYWHPVGTGFGRHRGHHFKQTGVSLELQETQNEAVLATLERLTQQNFGYDKAAWRAWFGR
ncbi:MAG TPA: HEAT repeat domain-containing protein [Pirellulales bacterium]